jgi:hypothetical protein
MNLPVEVVEAVNKGKCVLFVGRRASREAAAEAGLKYPTEKQLARKIAGHRASLEEALAGVRAKGGRPAVHSALEDWLGVDDVQPTEFHRIAIKRFPLIFTSAPDDLLERAALQLGAPAEVLYRGQSLPKPDPAKRYIYKYWGGFERPDTLCLSQADRRQVTHPADHKKRWRHLLKDNVLFFIGFRPDEAEFEDIWADISESYGGELPRCHLAVAQGRINDVIWQKWVWRGLLLFLADPIEAAEELERQISV